jgi:hypothetical protein
MPMLLDECRKNSIPENIAEWVDEPKRKGKQEHRKRDAIWNRSLRAPSLGDKHKSPMWWAVSVREKSESAKRMIRVFRWRHRARPDDPVRLFYAEADKWKNETMHWSSIAKVISHPSYLRIIGLGRKFPEGEIEKLILCELQNEPYHWFDALEAITGTNPVKPDDDFDAAIEAWLEWGRQEGIIANHNATGVEC